MSSLEKIARFVRKSPGEKWAAVRATLGWKRRSAEQLLYQIEQLRKMTEQSAILTKELFVSQVLLADERYADPKRLERCGFKVYSQNDEDGIIQEIFRRIGITNRRFVEFGVANGLENNTLSLLVSGWRGLWIDAAPENVINIKTRFADVLVEGRLAVQDAFITAENINELIGIWGSGEIDLLSIDIDGNDFYVWQALNVVKPRVVVIEYNAKFHPPLAIVQEYNAGHVWKGTDYFGASLEALVRLGTRLGYSLVCTNFSGVNAFFVRNDILGNRFQTPFTAENHFNPPRYFLWPLYVPGHTPDWGRYIEAPDSSEDNFPGPGGPRRAR